MGLFIIVVVFFTPVERNAPHYSPARPPTPTNVTHAGTVVVWWASTGFIMMKSKVHAGPVQQLQFDATKVGATIHAKNHSSSSSSTGSLLKQRGIDSQDLS